MNRSSCVSLVVLLCALPLEAWSDPVRDLADASYPRIEELATGIIVATWAERLPTLLTAAPPAAGVPRWAPGDPHWEAATKTFLAHVEQWAGELAADPHAKEAVRQAFARNLDEPTATAFQRTLDSDAKRSALGANDAIHLAVSFAGKHPDLKIGSPEFSKAYDDWLKSGKLTATPPTEESSAILGTDSGRAYDRARSSAIIALVSAIDGQIQLVVHDRQSALLDEIGKEASACKAAH